ncbi:MAG TPA: NifB/NifX family molybdenum-iron cluster-binding protein [Deltaproteobacteria bacterium]|nr:NifB/NifX family molybdenum-iron cluster-binding protein [Deltaproteobacteria bacterium]
MVKIAIPLFDQRVSPRFDCAQDFLLASVENGDIVKRRELSASGWNCRERVKKLSELGVDTLICGGIDKLSERMLIAHRVRTYTWVTGMAEDALNSYLRGELESYTMVGSGGRLRGRWRFNRGHTDDQYNDL